MTLYHFTCTHGARDIGRGPTALLLPHLHPLLDCKVTWLTSEPTPDREKTGLTMRTIQCNRMAYRYVVEQDQVDLCRPWFTSYERTMAPKDRLSDLESLGDPEHWWITSVPVRARFDRSYRNVGDLAIR